MTPDQQDAVTAVKRRAEEWLLAVPGVTAVGVGSKIVGGEVTDRLAIIVYVVHKTTGPGSDTIPAMIEGVPTDIIETQFLPPTGSQSSDPAVPELDPVPDKSWYPVLCGGISISPAGPDIRDSAGTLGYVVLDSTASPCILTCYHVLSPSLKFQPGTDVVQQGTADGGNPPAVATTTLGFLDSYIDAMIARLTFNRNPARPMSIVSLGTITGALNGPPARYTSVYKRGRTTLMTAAVVESTDVTWTLYPIYGTSWTLYEQIVCRAADAKSKVAAPGDSGAVVVNGEMRAAGLLCSTSVDGSAWIMNNIRNIVSRFGISFVFSAA